MRRPTQPPHLLSALATLALLFATTVTATEASTSASEASDWPEWRGPDQNGVANGTLPADLAPDAATWSIDLPGMSTSTPIVIGRQIILTSQLGKAPIAASRDGGGGSGDSEVTFLVLSFSLDDGKELWRHSLISDGVLPSVHMKHNLASPSVVSDGERLIAWFGTGQIVSLSIDGELEWQRHLGREISPFEVRWAHGSSPVLVGDRLLLLCDHTPESYLLAVDKKSGKTLWKADRGAGKRSYSTPLAIPHGDGTAVIVNSNDRIDAYDPETGEVLWFVGQPVRVPVSTPVWHDGVLYTSRGYRSGPYMAVRTGGSGDVNESHILWRVATGAPYVSSLLYYDGLIYFAMETGVASAVDPASGETVWRQRMGGNFSASPFALDGKVVLANEEGELFVVAAGREYQQLSKAEYPERIMASPVVAGGKLLIRTDSRLYAFQSK